jgi:predicted metal-binding protein
MENYKAHLFICTNTNDEGDSCGARGAKLLRDEVKFRAFSKHPEWRKKIRINAAGCMGFCEKGITAVCYPQSEWKFDLTQESAPDLIAMLEDILKDKI